MHQTNFGSIFACKCCVIVFKGLDVNYFLFRVSIRFFKVSLDLFADEHNAVVSRYASLYPDNKCAFVNAFSVDVKDESIYMYPPFALRDISIRRFIHARKMIYLHHEFDGSNYHSVMLSRLFDYRILIGGRYAPCVLTPSMKNTKDGYYRPYSEPKFTYLYFKGYSSLSVQYLSNELILCSISSIPSLLQHWKNLHRYPYLFTVHKL